MYPLPCITLTRVHTHTHYNFRLKFHVGLLIPRAPDGSFCANLTVAGKSRAWEEGKVLFFDDSFTHSVRSTCDSERVVFQLIIGHPDHSPTGREVAGH